MYALLHYVSFITLCMFFALCILIKLCML